MRRTIMTGIITAVVFFGFGLSVIVANESVEESAEEATVSQAEQTDANAVTDANSVMDANAGEDVNSAADANSTTDPNATQFSDKELRQVEKAARKARIPRIAASNEWKKRHIRNRVDLFEATNEQAVEELNAVREIALEENALMTVATIDMLLEARMQVFEATKEVVSEYQKRDEEEEQKEMEKRVERTTDRTERRGRDRDRDKDSRRSRR